MNQIIAGIYGTGGQEKVASQGGRKIETLTDLALLIALEGGDGSDHEKVASVQESALSDLVNFDRSGRAMAHYEFSQMEKEASEGNGEALTTFFADLLEEPAQPPSLKDAVVAELARRATKS